MKNIPTVFKYMSTQPHSVSFDQTVEQALKIMRENRIRHLPVLKAGKLFGVVSDRDLKLYQSLKGADLHKDSVEDVCIPEVFTASPESPLDEVCSTMAEHHYGCAVITDNAKVVGIFTAVDGLRAVSDLLRTRLH